MANDLYRTYEVLVEESVHPDHPKRAKDRTSKPERFNAELDGALRDTHMIFQDAVCYNTLCIAGLAGNEELPAAPGEKPKPLNPLWKYLTSSAPGGINAETEKMICRLATHYKPLEGVKTAKDFLNRVYSEPLQTHGGMTDAEREAVMLMRAQCYRILEKYGTKQKTNGGLECEDMSAFANTWTGLTSIPGSITVIPGNGAYDCVSRELQERLKGVNDDEAALIIKQTLLRYSAEEEAQSKVRCEAEYSEKLDELKEAVAHAEQLPDTDKTKTKKLKTAKDKVAKHEREKADAEKEFFTQLRDNLAADVTSAASMRFIAKTGAELGLTDDEFAEAREAAKSVEPLGKQLIRLREKKGRPGRFEAAMFRYWLLHDGASGIEDGKNKLLKRAALREFRRFIEKDDPVDEPKLDGEPIRQMPFRGTANFAFLFFGKACLEILPNESTRSSPDRDFDKTAFATAAEDVFKYKIRTNVRMEKVRKLLHVVQAYESFSTPLELRVEDSPTGKRLTIHGLMNDPRWKGNGEESKGIEQLLKDLRKEEAGAYGLREGTIGGWAEVRKTLVDVHREAQRADGEISNEAELVKNLEKAMDDEMEANRQGFGSADLFHALCDPAYFHLWLGGADHEHNGVKDFLPHFVRYCEWREELIDLLIEKDGSAIERGVDMSSAKLAELAKRPIKYTWPGLLNRHKKPSYRYYDFAEQLNTALQFKSLFRRLRPSGESNRVARYEKLTGEKAKVTLAARRLKRDKLINKDTGNSVDALWCPPLILEGEATPKTANRPRAGKYDDAKKKVWPSGDVEVSYSLMAAPLPGDFWNEVAGVPSAGEKQPIHLTVSFKIEAEALAQLQQEGVHFVGKSLKGVDEEDDKRKFFRWPVDIESDKLAAKEAEEKSKHEAAKTGKETAKSAKRVDVKPTELWCHYEGGFRVKESHYSKAEKTTNTPDFHILSIDLGNRFAAAFSRLRIHAEAEGGGKGRVISADGFLPIIKAELVREGTMRLQGEDAEVWQLVTEKNQKHIAARLKARGENRKPVVGAYEWVEEKFGNGGRGRFPTADEYAAFAKLAARLVPVEAVSLIGKDKETYPELADHLIFRLKRKIGRLRTLLNLIWRLHGDKEKDGKGRYTVNRDHKKMRPVHYRMVMEMLARSAFPKRQRQPDEVEDRDDQNLRLKLASQDQWDEWRPLFESKKGKEENDRRQNLEAVALKYAPTKWLELAEAVKEQITDYCEDADSLDKLLVAVIEFCLPLRGRHWSWSYTENKARLSWGKDDEDPAWNPNIQGMRGLSMRRLDQILNLRQRCQSFAKLEDRYHRQFLKNDFNPPDSVPREEIDDVCPLLLERSNRIREQRVNQAAHLILAEALGMELKNPAEVENKNGRKNEVDLHGEYQRRKDKNGKPYPRCSVIVLENLERYRTSQERTRSENSRLMQWAHRAIIEKLEDMCRPFGITLMLVDPAFTSHFDSRNGLPGVRVNQVSRGFHVQYPYAKWINDKTKKGDKTSLALEIEKLIADFDAHPNYGGTLVLAVEGGKEFVPVMSPEGGESVVNADITAAANIGLRGVADPQRWDIFPRLRTKQVSDTQVRVTSWRGWFGKLMPEQRMMGKAVAGGVSELPAPAAKTKRKKADSEGAETGDKADSQSGQSSEYPPFFVEHPQHDWLPANDWLKKLALEFVQDGKKLRAYPQGAYLKRVELECTTRIEAINRARIQKWERGNDDVPM